MLTSVKNTNFAFMETQQNLGIDERLIGTSSDNFLTETTDINLIPGSTENRQLSQSSGSYLYENTTLERTANQDFLGNDDLINDSRQSTLLNRSDDALVGNENFVFEAENSQVSGAVEVQFASQASKSGVIQAPIWKEWHEGEAIYPSFTPRVGGDYYVWLRVAASTERDIGEDYQKFDYRLPYKVSLAANDEAPSTENTAENSTVIPSRFYNRSAPEESKNNNLYWIRVTNDVVKEYSSAAQALKAPADDAFKFNLAAGEEAKLSLINDRGARYQPVQIDKVFITSNPSQTPVGSQSDETTLDVRGVGSEDTSAVDLSTIDSADSVSAALNYHDNFLRENPNEPYSKSSSFIWKPTLFPTAESSQHARNAGRFASSEQADDAHLSVWKRSDTENGKFRFRNRAELDGEYGSGGIGTENWYAFSTRIDDWDKSEIGSQDIIAQWRLEPDSLNREDYESEADFEQAKSKNGNMPPPLSFLVETVEGEDEPEAVFKIINQHNDEETWFEDSVSRPKLYSEQLEEDRWIDWVVHTKWSDKDGDGLIEIWKDGEKLTLEADGIATKEWTKGNIWNQTENGLEFKLGIYHISDDTVEERQIYHDEVRVASGIVGFDEMSDIERRISEPTVTPPIPTPTNPINGTFDSKDTWSASGTGLESFENIGERARIAVKPGSIDPADTVLKTDAFNFPAIDQKKIYRLQFDARSVNNLGQKVRTQIRYNDSDNLTFPKPVDKFDFYTSIKNKRYIVDFAYSNVNPPSSIELEFLVGGLAEKTALIEIDNVRVDQIGVGN